MLLGLTISYVLCRAKASYLSSVRDLFLFILVLLVRCSCPLLALWWGILLYHRLGGQAFLLNSYFLDLRLKHFRIDRKARKRRLGKVRVRVRFASPLSVAGIAGEGRDLRRD